MVSPPYQWCPDAALAAALDVMAIAARAVYLDKSHFQHPVGVAAAAAGRAFGSAGAIPILQAFSLSLRGTVGRGGKFVCFFLLVARFVVTLWCLWCYFNVKANCNATMTLSNNLCFDSCLR